MPNLYKRVELNGQLASIKRLSDGAFIALDPRSADYQQFLADGGDAVTAAADPPPLVFTTNIKLGGRLRTTNATVTEIYRATLRQNTGYAATANLLGVDAGDGTVRLIRASFCAKRLSGNAILVGSVVVLADHADVNALTWAANATVSGTDFVITVKGAAGRNIDWTLDGDVVAFTPAGA